MLWCIFVTYICRGIVSSSKKMSSLRIPCLGIVDRHLTKAVVSRAVNKWSVDSVGGTGRVPTITYRGLPLFRSTARE